VTAGRPALRGLLAGWRDRTWPHRLLAGQRPEPASVVAVAGVAPRSGTTTVATLLATAYAEPRCGRVVVVEAGPGVGRLGERLAVPAGSMVPELTVAPGLDSWPVLAPYLEPAAEGLWTVAAGEGAAGAAEPELLTSQAALAVLSPHFAVIVLDCGHQAGTQARFMLGLAQARLLVGTASVDGLLAAAAALDRLELSHRPDAAARTLVGLVATCDRAGVHPAEAGALLRARGGEVRWFPHDPALAGGGPIALAELSAGLRAATVGAAAELLRRSGRTG
jgi:MinD-like ATPase involved in chromosome partitioning or flagellar assembly